MTGRQSFRENVTYRLRRLLINVWPDNCPLCGRPLHRGETPLCLDCLAQMPRIRTDQNVFYVGAPGNKVEVRSWFFYNSDDPSHKLIHQIKYNGGRRLARKLGRELARQKLERSFDADVILPVPLHWTKYVKRSYNQSFEIALGVKDVTGVKIGKNLYARRAHASQTSRSRQERDENVRGIFGVRRPHELDNKKVVILDDVITTGATMLSALNTILAVSKPASVVFVSLAHTRHEP